ncbi:MAG: HlyC/CorC family transporter [Nitrospirota bacterium]|nr:MAG: HlyC/CorC family transporter [Nitrospirota bacterium]
MWIEIILIFVFIIINGFFSGSEIAVVTARRTRIKELFQKGSSRARVLRKLQSDPERFFATVQVGVTIAGAVASAIAGAAAVKYLEPFLSTLQVEVISNASEGISIGIVVICVSYVSLIFGELVPKSLALKNPERIAMTVARPLVLFEKIATIFISLLTFSTNLILKPFGSKAYSQRSFVSEEEIKLLISEGTDRGVFEPDEESLIHGVFEFTDLSVKEVMVPLTKTASFSMDCSIDELLATIKTKGYSRYPVYHTSNNNIKGILYVKDLFRKLASEESIDIKRLMRTPYFVPESMKISSLLREMQKKGVLIAVTVDEYGAVTGIVTIEDLLEEIVGEIRDEYDVEQPVIRLKEDSFFIDASISIRDLKEDHSIEIPESADYDTLGGFIITSLQRIPGTGETFQVNEWEIKIVHMVEKRIARVILKKLPMPEPDEDESVD